MIYEELDKKKQNPDKVPVETQFPKNEKQQQQQTQNSPKNEVGSKSAAPKTTSLLDKSSYPGKPQEIDPEQPWTKLHF